jgi:hypothetical protein
VIEVRAYVKTFGGLVPVDTPVNITYYQIEVLGSPCWPASVNDIDAYGFEVNELVPNPVFNTTELRFKSTSRESLSLKVFNLLGQEVYSTFIQSTVGDNKAIIDASKWSNGIYLYSLSNGRNNRLGKLQVMK